MLTVITIRKKIVIVMIRIFRRERASLMSPWLNAEL